MAPPTLSTRLEIPSRRLRCAPRFRWGGRFAILTVLLGLADTAAAQTGNIPPVVGAGSSVSGGPGGTVVTLMASPSDTDGTIDHVEYYDGDRYLGTVWAEPYHLKLRRLNKGPLSESYRMIAVDNLGARSAPGVVNSTGSSGTAPAELPVRDGLHLWLRADLGVTADAGGLVSAWKDQSGKGRDAGPLSAAYSPTGTEAPVLISNVSANRPAIRFDGVDDVLEIAAGPAGEQVLGNWTVIFAGRRRTGSAGDFAPVISSRPGTGGLDEGWAVAFNSEGRIGTHFADGVSGHGLGQALSSLPLSSMALEIWQAEEDQNARTTRFFVNANPDAEISVLPTTAGINLAQPIHLGRELVGGNQRRASLDLAELIVFSRLLSAAERESVTTYLASRYQVPAVVVTNQPPVANLTGPAVGQRLTWKAPVNLSATASDADGGILKVEFFAGEQSLGARSEAPFEITTTDLPPGPVDLTVQVTDNLGVITTSPKVTVESLIPLAITLETSGGTIQWEGPGTLETTFPFDASWTSVPGASSPHSFPITSSQQYFRLRPLEGAVDPSTPDYGYDPTAEESIPAGEPLAGLIPPPFATANVAFLPPVGQQGTREHPGYPGSCAAWASTYGLATFTAAKHGNYSPTNAAQQASPANIYIQVLNQNPGMSNQCSGSQMTSYFQRLTNSGTASLLAAPYYASCSNLWATYGGQDVPPDPTFKISQVATVATTNLTAIKQILASNRVLAYGTRLYTNWSAYRGVPMPYVGNGVIALMPNGKPVGHCMLIIGYDDTKQALLIQNSEGSNWGSTIGGEPPNAEGTDGGYIWMAYSTFTSLAQGRAFYEEESSQDPGLVFPTAGP
ncbi:MAG: hypothetical protein J0M24_26230 [Verrucomicrobia bacterium]|nr:hypothetical protein [Verrucomicrobiota bacterium]